MKNTNQAMEKDEKKCLIDDVDEQFEFPWTLLSTTEQIIKYFQKKPKWIILHDALHSFHFQLLIIFVLNLITLIVAICYKKDCSGDYNLVVIPNIIQSSINLAVVLIHVCANVFE